MAKKFKDYYDKECVKLHIQKFIDSGLDIDIEKYKRGIIGQLEGKEFMQRQEIFAKSLKNALKIDYPIAIVELKNILGGELKQETGMFTEGWWLWPFSKYVELNCLDYPQSVDDTLDFIEELTKRFTGEYAVRFLLEKYTDITLKRIDKWSKSKNVHLRRLSSEAIRVKLPWSMKLDVFLKNFDRCYLILDNLKKDESKFVQKSVANNINDLFKVNPEYAKVFVDQWSKINNKNTQWILKHGQRWINSKK